MEKAQLELFRAMRSGDIAKARRAYDKGANINWPLDRWMERGHPHWGLRVQVKPLGIYLGFSAREHWRVPDGEDADRGDTFLMVALKCRMHDAVVFLLGCDRLNLNCLNEAGNSAADIARATGQEFLLRGRWGGSSLPQPSNPQQAGEFEEARPAWEREGAAAAAAGTGAGTVPAVPGGSSGTMHYASVVAEAVPQGATNTTGAGATPVVATATEVGGFYSQPTTGHATAAEVSVATPIDPNNNPYGQAGRRDGARRDPAQRTDMGFGTEAYGAF